MHLESLSAKLMVCDIVLAALSMSSLPGMFSYLSMMVKINFCRRWTFYVLLIWTGVLLVSMVFFVPETYHPVYVPSRLSVARFACTDRNRLMRRKAQKLRKETGDDRWVAPIEKMHRSVAQTILRSMYRPILLLVLEPMCLNLCIFSAILLGILYLFFGAFQLVFETVYGMLLWQRGLCFLGLFVGMVFAILSDPVWRWNYARLERNYQKATNNPDEFQPEWRLPPGKSWTFQGPGLDLIHYS